ncbi:hypothetical protein HY484_03520 [Candidatus Woesearchaeota archaeon]|nr:hypothetical protein [Candidatus Woesearchaeota archaeon]
MNEINKAAMYSILGMVAVFLVVATTVQSGITGGVFDRTTIEGKRAYEILGSETIRIGKCTTANPRCPEGFFCDALLQKSPCSHLIGDYAGDCVKKYDTIHNHLCKRNFQCATNRCNADEIKCGGLQPPQVGVCV